MTTRDVRAAQEREMRASQIAREITAESRLFKQFKADAEDLGGRSVRFTITTGDVDRENDIVDPSGINLANYLKNPAVLWSHDHHTPAIARTTRIDRSGNGLVAECQFAPADVHPLAEQIYQLVIGGFIRGASIGFIPVEWSYDNTRGGVNFLQVEVIEWSVCNVPANASALVAASAAGLDTGLVRHWAKGILGVSKAGARHNASDVATIQRIHDDALGLGANCKDDDPDDDDEVTASLRRRRAMPAQRRQRDDEVVIVLRDDDEDDRVAIDEADLRALPSIVATTLRETLEPIMRQEMTSAFARLRGQIVYDTEPGHFRTSRR